MATKQGQRVRAQVRDLPSYIPHVPVFDGEDSLDAAKEADAFLSRFSEALAKQDWDAFGNLFVDDGYWKENLTLAFDNRTLQGKSRIVDAWKTLSVARKPEISTAKQGHSLSLPAAFTRLAPVLATLDVPFSFSLDAPRMNCVGMAKLIPQDGAWKIWVLATAGDSLQDSPFSTLPRQSPSLVPESQRGKAHAQNLPAAKGIFDAVVVGGSTSGVATTIMLESIGANVITFDNREQAGGNWSEGGKAYVTLHHLPKLMELPQHPIPEKFSKDLGGYTITEYVSSAVEALKLPVFCGITVLGSSFDEASGLWDVRIEDMKTKQQETVQTKNVILALAPISSQDNPYYPSLKDREVFKGPVQHSSQYKDAKPYAGKNVVVVGASNSAHDIARNLAEGGAANVTLLQRGPTAFFKWENIQPLIEGPYATPLDLYTSDFLYLMTLPLGVGRDMAKGAMAAMEASQTDFYAALEAKGYSIQKNRDFVSQVFESRNGHFFMDRQKSLDFVFNDRIKVARGEAIQYAPEGLVVRNPATDEKRVLNADGVVLATGFQTIDFPQKWADDGFLDRKSASVLENPCSMEIDPEGEMLSQFTNSGHRHLYYASHNVINCRVASRAIAIQIMADLKGEFPEKLSRPEE